MKPFVDLICDIISLIELALAIYIILQLLVNFDVVERDAPLIVRLRSGLGRLLEPMLRPIRNAVGKYLTHFGGIDLSPIILWLLLRFLRNALISWFYIQPLMTTTVVSP